MRAKRRDYQRIAAALHRAAKAGLALHPATRVVDALATELADILEEDNAAFDRDRFFAEVWKGVPK